MTATRLLVLCFLLLPALGCASTEADERFASLFPEQALTLLEAPTGVLVWRITPSLDAREEDQREDLHGHAYRAGPVSALDHDELGPAWWRRLRGVLAEQASYDFENPKACITKPGFMIQVEGPGGPLDVLLCFECEIVDRYWKGEVWSQDWLHALTPELWELMRQVFPDDPVFETK